MASFNPDKKMIGMRDLAELMYSKEWSYGFSMHTGANETVPNTKTVFLTQNQKTEQFDIIDWIKKPRKDDNLFSACIS